jgi:DNA-binding transcriptional ArsR family regulator
VVQPATAQSESKVFVVSEIDQTLSALADPTRRGVIDLLRVEPRRAGALAQALRMSGPALSRHLRVLRRSGLVEEDHQGEDARIRTYRLRREPFAELDQWVHDVTDFWKHELEGFKQYTEKTRGAKKARR